MLKEWMAEFDFSKITLLHSCFKYKKNSVDLMMRSIEYP